MTPFPSHQRSARESVWLGGRARGGGERDRQDLGGGRGMLEAVFKSAVSKDAGGGVMPGQFLSLTPQGCVGLRA